MPPDVRAYLFFGLLAASVVAAVLFHYLRGVLPPVQACLEFGSSVLTRLWWRTSPPKKAIRRDKSRGAVVISNHRSSVDPFFLQLAADGQISWMVAREYVVHPAFGWFLKSCDVIPTRRGGIDTDATKLAIRRAAAGRVVGMFPEGRINTTEDLLLPVRPGPIFVALKARVPIIPCYIEDAPFGGTPWSPFFIPAHVKVHVGEPIDLSAAYGRERDSQVIRDLLLEAMRAVAALAGHPEYEPQLAGRDWLPPPAEKKSRKVMRAAATQAPRL